MPSRRRASPKDRAHTRTRILEAAIDVFAEHGFEGASTREICGRAHVNGAALNYHFRSKELMWLAVCGEVSARIQRIAFASVSQKQTPREALRSFLGGLFDALRADPRPAQIMMWTALGANRLDFDNTLEMFQPVVDIGRGYFGAAQKSGMLAPDVDVHLVLPILFAQFIYPFVAQRGQRRIFGSDASDAAFANRLRAVLIRSAELLLGVGPKGHPPARRRR